jgi:hypothetical protein
MGTRRKCPDLDSRGSFLSFLFDPAKECLEALSLIRGFDVKYHINDVSFRLLKQANKFGCRLAVLVAVELEGVTITPYSNALACKVFHHA